MEEQTTIATLDEDCGDLNPIQQTTNLNLFSHNTPTNIQPSRQSLSLDDVNDKSLRRSIFFKQAFQGISNTKYIVLFAEDQDGIWVAIPTLGDALPFSSRQVTICTERIIESCPSNIKHFDFFENNLPSNYKRDLKFTNYQGTIQFITELSHSSGANKRTKQICDDCCAWIRTIMIPPGIVEPKLPLEIKIPRRVKVSSDVKVPSDVKVLSENKIQNQNKSKPISTESDIQLESIINKKNINKTILDLQLKFIQETTCSDIERKEKLKFISYISEYNSK